MRIVITGHDDVFAAAAAIEELARAHAIAVTRADSDLLDGVRARFPGVTLAVE